MAGMTWGDMLDELGKVFDPNQSTRYTNWLKWGLHDFVMAADWSWREATSSVVSLVAGQSNYVLSGTSPVIPDFGGMLGVTLELTGSGVRVPLARADVTILDRFANHSRLNAVPAMYAEAGGTPATTAAAVTAGGKRDLVLWPFPIATSGNGTGVIIRYLRSTSTVEPTANSDIPIVPIAFQRGVLFRTLEYGFAANRQYPNAADYNRRATEVLARAIAADSDVKPSRDPNIIAYTPRPGAQSSPVQQFTPASAEQAQRAA